MNKAVHYLGRYNASQHRLREVLDRFAKRKLGDMDEEVVRTASADVVATCQRLGYVNDVEFAAGQARSQRRQGRSSLAIRQRLRGHALDEASIEAALGSADDGHQNAELAAAIQFVRRRRLGVFFRGITDDKTAQRHLASLARAGFALAICKTVLSAQTVDQLEAIEATALAADPETFAD